MAFVREVPSRAFAGEVGEWNSDVGVMRNEMSIEISKTQERLYIFNLSRFRPILDDLYFISCHGESEDVIHKTLKSCRHVHKSEGHDMPFEGAVVGAESCFPFIALSDMDQVVCVMEVNFCIESCLAWAVKEVRDAG